MIPDAAVSAALVASAEFKNQRGVDNASRLMRHILEAAAPHMLAPITELAGRLSTSRTDGDSYQRGTGHGLRIAAVHIYNALEVVE